MDKSKLTQQIMEEIMDCHDLNKFIGDNQDNFVCKDLHKSLLKKLHEKNSSIPEIIQKANLDKGYTYQIFNGQKHPSRNKIILISIALGLDCEETQKLLKIGNKGVLYPKDERDAVILFCIKTKKSVIDSQELLNEIGLALLE